MERVRDRNYVYIYSNSKRESAGYNTLSKFENVFPVTLNAGSQKKWYIALRAIRMDSTLDINLSKIFNDTKHFFRCRTHSQLLYNAVGYTKNIQLTEGSIVTLLSDLAIELRDKKTDEGFQIARDNNGFVYLGVSNASVLINLKLMLALGFDLSYLEKFGTIKYEEGWYKIEYFEGNKTIKIKASHKIRLWCFHSRFFQVHCDQLQPNKFIIEERNKRLLYQSEFSQSGASLRIEPRHLEFYEIGQKELTSLSFTLTDEHSNQLQMSHGGQATTLEVELRRIDDGTGNEMEHIIHLMSNTSQLDYPNNHNASFSTSLPSPLTLLPLEEWEVGLLRIHTSCRVNHFPFEQNDGRGYVIATTEDGVTYTRDVTDVKRIYLSAVDFVQHVNKKLEDIENVPFKFEYKPSSGKIELNCTKKMTFHMHNYLWLMFGGKLDENVPFDGFTTKVIDVGLFLFENPVNHKMFVPHSILVYSDIVMESIVGSSFSNLLKQIHFLQPINEDEAVGQITLEPEHIEYVPINHSYITKIHIELRSNAGGLIDYIDKQEPVIVSLKFRRRRANK